MYKRIASGYPSRIFLTDPYLFCVLLNRVRASEKQTNGNWWKRFLLSRPASLLNDRIRNLLDVKAKFPIPFKIVRNLAFFSILDIHKKVSLALFPSLDLFDHYVVLLLIPLLTIVCDSNFLSFNLLNICLGYQNKAA